MSGNKEDGFIDSIIDGGQAMTEIDKHKRQYPKQLLIFLFILFKSQGGLGRENIISFFKDPNNYSACDI